MAVPFLAVPLEPQQVPPLVHPLAVEMVRLSAGELEGHLELLSEVIKAPPALQVELLPIKREVVTIIETETTAGIIIVTVIAGMIAILGIMIMVNTEVSTDTTKIYNPLRTDPRRNGRHPVVPFEGSTIFSPPYSAIVVQNGPSLQTRS